MTRTHKRLIGKTIFLCLIFLMIQSNSIRALEELSTDVQLLVKALQDQDVSVRRNAAASLEGLGKAANAAVPALIDTLSDPDANVRRNAAAALEKYREKAEVAIPTLIKLLNDDEPAVRQVAAKTLGGLKAKAAPAVPTLVAIADDEDPYVRYQAHLALHQIVRDVKTVDPSLINALKNKNSRIRFVAAVALGAMRENAASASSALVAVLNDEDYGIGLKAMEALVNIGRAAAPALMSALKDESAPPRTRRIAALILGQSRLKDVSNISTAIAMLNSNDTWIRAFAADLVAGIGPKARAAVPDLVQALHDDSIEVRRKAAKALEKLGPDAVTALGEALIWWRRWRMRRLL
jgi:HEAT repeat protein